MHPAARHLDGAAERDFAVALAKMQIAHGQARTIDIDREVDLRAARQILDINVAAMFARRYRTCRLGSGLVVGLAGLRNRGLASGGT
jgi:hypothetical protein